MVCQTWGLYAAHKLMPREKYGIFIDGLVIGREQRVHVQHHIRSCKKKKCAFQNRLVVVLNIIKYN